MMALVLVAPLVAAVGWSMAPAEEPEMAPSKAVVPSDLGASVLSAPHELRFEPNLGQAPGDVRYLARGVDAEMWLHDDRITAHAPGGSLVLRFPGADADDLTPQQPLQTRMHHYVGQDPDAWVRDAPTYAQVRYHDLWEGVDLLVYGTEDGRLEFDHIVAPGADLGAVRFQVLGADARLEDGALVAAGDAGAFRLDPPVVYQMRDGQQAPVDAGFVLRGDEVRYRLGDHDPALPLVIDPVLRYASYLGNSGNDRGRAVAVHDPGTSLFERHVYVAGHTSSFASYPLGFPSGGEHRHEHATSPGMTRGVSFIAKFSYDVQNHTTSALWYAFLGGHSDAGGASMSANDDVHALAVDDNGEVVVVGETMSKWFPTVNPILDVTDNQGTYNGGLHSGIRPDAFVSRLSKDGDSLLFSSYIGNAPDEGAYAVDIAPTGEIVLAGYAQYNIVYGNSQFPTKNADQAFHSADGTGSGGTPIDAFVTTVDHSTSPATFGFSTFLGGHVANEWATSVSVDTNGVFVGGVTNSASVFPTTSGAYTTSGSGEYGFVAHYLLDGTKQYATLLGGSGTDTVEGVAVAGSGEVWAVGGTRSTDFPVCPSDCTSGSPSAFQSSIGGAEDAFVTRINSAGSGLTFSSYHGGSGEERALDAAYDPASGGVLMAGWTSSTDLPLEQDLLSSNPGGSSLMAARIDPDRTHPLAFSSYLGGTGDQEAWGIDGDEYAVIYLAGETETGFATASPVQAAHGGGTEDAFMTVLGKSPPDAWINASWSGNDEKSDVDAPVPPSALPTFSVPVGSPVDINASFSEATDFPLDNASHAWTLYDASGTIVELTDTGGLSPSFSPYALSFVDTRVVCVLVHDDRPLWHPDGKDQACIELEWVNRDPLPEDDEATVLEDSASNVIDVLDNDVDPDGHAITIDSVDPVLPSLGSLTHDGTRLFFTPAADLYTRPAHTGSVPDVTSEYTVKDEHGATAKAEVVIRVQNVNDAPNAVDDAFWVATGAVTPLDVLTNDDDAVDPPGALVVATTGQPSDGATHAYPDRIDYTAPADFVGTTTFDHTIQDADGATSTATVTLHVAPTDGVLARDDAYAIDEDQDAVFEVLDNDVGPDASPAAVLVDVSDAGHGHASIHADGLRITYRPDPDFFGDDAFTYTIQRHGTDSTATVNVTVRPINDAPTANNDTFAVQEDSADNVLPVLGNDTYAPDTSEVLQVVFVSDASHGTVVLAGGQLRYTPDPDFAGTDRFHYTVEDPNGLQDNATVDVLVDGIPDAPVAREDGYTVIAGLPDQRLDVLANDTDADGDALGVSGLEWDDQHGQLDDAGTELLVSPDLDAVGEVVFRYRASDGTLLSDWAEVTLQVVEPEPMLVLRQITSPLCAGQPIDVRLVALQAGHVATTWDLSAGGETALIHSTGPELDWTFTAHEDTDLTLAVLMEHDNGQTHWISDAWPLDMVACIAPKADFRTSTSGTDVAFEDLSSDADGHVAAWQWTFGDGATSTAASPVHAYGKAGVYLIGLTVTDDDGNTGTLERSITVGGRGSGQGATTRDQAQDQDTTASEVVLEDRPPVAVAAAPDRVPAGDSVVLDGSESFDPDGDALTYRWLQRAGPAVVLQDPTAKQAVFQATGPGELRFVLRVEANGQTNETERVVSVHVLPEAAFDVRIDEDVALDATELPNATYTWTVDGTTYTGPHQRLALPAGDHTVRLEVENAVGRAVAVQHLHVPATPEPEPGPEPEPTARASTASIQDTPSQPANIPYAGYTLLGALVVLVAVVSVWLVRARR